VLGLCGIQAERTGTGGTGGVHVDFMITKHPACGTNNNKRFLKYHKPLNINNL
jgi:hypothetical protein